MKVHNFGRRRCRWPTLMLVLVFVPAMLATAKVSKPVGGAPESIRNARGPQQPDGIFIQGETKDFLELLENIRYDHRQRPEPFGVELHEEMNASSGNPTIIGVSMFISSIRSVSEVTMDYSLELFFREYWTDPRLNWDPKRFRNKTELVLHESYSAFLWHPDTFVPNAINSKNPEGHSATHRSLLRLRPGGRILYSRRLSVTAECPMDLTLFPFDRQVCKLSIESYGYPTHDVVYKWNGINPVQLGNIRLPDFTLERVFTTSRNASYETGVYSRLYCCFIFVRSAGFCLLQLIIPASSAVIISWVSLWMEEETTFQDMISVILTITFLIFSYNAVMPRVSYIKAMDVFLGTCFFFVFFALLKLALVKYMKQRFRMPREQSIVCGVLPFSNGGADALETGAGPPDSGPRRPGSTRRRVYFSTRKVWSRSSARASSSCSSHCSSWRSSST